MELFAFDDDYAKRLREGDAWTLEHFHSYFQHLLLLKLRTKVRSMAEVDDVRQEVFARALKALRDTDEPRDARKLGAWVNGICNNVLFERYRKDERAADQLDETRHDAPADVDVETAFATRETAERVRNILAALPPRDASLLRAVFLEEEEKDEICRRFGVARDYLRVLVHRAKERFRDEYAAGKPLPFRRK
jgi:RNA polymerase sigma-70 factor (ECF subfamily)